MGSGAVWPYAPVWWRRVGITTEVVYLSVYLSAVWLLHSWCYVKLLPSRRTFCVQSSSRWYLSARKSPYALHPVSQKFPHRCLWNGSNVRLIDDGPLSSFQGRSSSVSSFNTSLLQAIDGVMSLAFRSSEKQATCPGQYTHRSFRRWMSTIDTFQSGLPILHFSLFVANSLNLWGWWRVWSDCNLLRQSSGGHGWLLPPPLSSWRLGLYWLHCLHGW